MKKTIFFFMLLSLSAAVWGDTFYTEESENFKVHSSVSQENALQTLEIQEQLLSLFKSFFYTKDTEGLMNVYVLKDKEEYNKHLESLFIASRNDFVFLKYNVSENNRIIIYEGKENYERSLGHQSCLQYMDKFFPKAPSWMKKGFAVYFESIEIKEEGVSLSNTELWLSTAKKRLNHDTNEYDLLDILETTQEASVKKPHFSIDSWALISFLINAEDKEYSRLLYDTISLLRWTQESENFDTEGAITEIFNRKRETLARDIYTYIDSQKIFTEIVNSGIKLFLSENYKEAEAAFQHARDKDDTHYLPYYYLGLISYKLHDYNRADSYYSEATKRDAPRGLLYYAMGLNEYSRQNYSIARIYLNDAKLTDPAKYSEKVDELLEKIKE